MSKKINKKYAQKHQVSRKKSVIRFFVSLCLGLVLLSAVLMFSQKAFADDDLTPSEMAAAKKYPGAIDEGELKVQQALLNQNNQKPKTEESTEGF